VNDVSELQQPKHSSQITSTDDGIQIDFKSLQLENALHSIRVSAESDSNVTDERVQQPPKHMLQRSSTPDGKQIDFNSLQREKALLSIRVSLESA
jgi:hypothetical protein